mmetsp:Transcript_31065/g.88646  ORF Transcript_31065/g.88646 Transcript_31065/m.88646 type:complete len:208 (+) Transcript_31065:88-711(+)
MGTGFLQVLGAEVVLRQQRADLGHELGRRRGHLLAILDDATLQYPDGQRRSADLRAQLAHLPHDPHALHNGAEDNMVPVVHLLLGQRDHELGAVGIFAPVHHRKIPFPQELEVEVLIREALSVDAGAMGLAGAHENIAANNRRTWLDVVEECVPVPDHLVLDPIAFAELQEVLARQRDLLGVQAYHDAAGVLVANRDVHVDLVADVV